MAADLSDLVSSVKSTGTPGALALVGIYSGSTAHLWQKDFQWTVSAVALALLCLSGLWFAGMMIGRLTDWPPLRRLEGSEADKTPQLPDSKAPTSIDFKPFVTVPGKRPS